MVERTVGDPHGGVTRRGFLGRSLTFGVAACAMCGALPSWAQGNREIKFSHGTGLCNMPLFYAAEKKLFAKYAIESNVVLSGWAGDQAIQHIGFVSPWCKHGERTAALRDDKAFSRPHSPQVATQILAQLTNPDALGQPDQNVAHL